MNQELLIATVRQLDELAVLKEPESLAEAIDIWQMARSLLEEHVIQMPVDGELVYLLAYVDYMLWARIENEQLWVESRDLASKCSNDNPLAKYLLICLYFENGKWVEMGEIDFKEHERQWLSSKGQDWRLAKVMEMRFAAEMRSGGIDGLQLSDQLFDEYRSATYPELLFPITAGSAIEGLLAQQTGDELSNDLVEICQRLRDCSVISQTLELMIKRFPLLASEWTKNVAIGRPDRSAGPQI